MKMMSPSSPDTGTMAMLSCRSRMQQSGTPWPHAAEVLAALHEKNQAHNVQVCVCPRVAREDLEQ
jgi:hypothetical protein